jgi:hypothetical protein
MAIDDHLALAVQLIQPLGELIHRHVDSASKVAQLPFLKLADIDEEWPVRLRQPLGQLARAELTHALGYVLLFTLHVSSAYDPDTRPDGSFMLPFRSGAAW